ncbi:glycosyltransferase family 2 protein [Sulfitobacter donghicola]|uniref:Glycosyl transferase n=1 Tax=Sulfitobacter donghicola DSW-25 = KCTC 12864 = JCM 14565 TaxID=1300350 RepID=A0A073ILT2_9RHOB|nr:glycosyltransferase [Sulfitobacter donghicola]KEJ90704.1 glycosyl transferase [Sulfitobacter donghicola DSW-25 = KCTC 12864 = JCM 14565]KIN67957.1 Glycosyl transferase, family 2 [Sulfitobacter donghicola DSW-25 = KCTC 12864 = JCM 14565]
MSVQTVSVIIVSRERPEALRRCLAAVAQLQYPQFEVVVVACPAGIAVTEQCSALSEIKCIAFDEANISKARNIGIEHAAGEIIAFIDDDAVPEPTWLRHLVAPAQQGEVAAMGGFVRGRNGITFQNKARTLDAHGLPQNVEIDALQATVLHPPKGRAIKTEGTNMAFRRDVLIDIGGFDPAFRFFLDETDVNMRLARAGHATALVPLAQVHHGFAESATRRKDRVPRDLYEIGASWGVFQRKHIPKDERADHWRLQYRSERHRLLTHMVAGRLEPRDVRRLMKRLSKGYKEGQERSFGGAAMAKHAVLPFRPVKNAARAARFSAVRGLRGKTLLKEAATRVAAGNIETVLILSRTALFHKTFFNEDGVWVQRGGIFGRSDRAAPLFRLTSFQRKLVKEKERVALVRGLFDA